MSIIKKMMKIGQGLQKSKQQINDNRIWLLTKQSSEFDLNFYL